MNFSCPACDLSGQIDDARLPPQGLYATCPRCKSSFLVKQEVAPSPISDGGGHTSSTAENTVPPAPASPALLSPHEEKTITAPSVPQRPKDTAPPNAGPANELNREPAQKKGENVAVRIIGCLFIAVAGFKIISIGIGSLVMTQVAGVANGMLKGASSLPGVSTGLHGLWLAMALQLILWLFIIVAAVQFLRLRAWGRTALEIASWIGLAYSITMGIMETVAWGQFTGAASAAALGAVPSGFGAMAVAMTVLAMIVVSVPLIVIIWFLRGEAIRGTVSVQSGKQPREAGL